MKHAIRHVAVAASLVLAACGTQESPPAATQPGESQPAVDSNAPVVSQSTIAEYMMPGDAVESGNCALDAINGVAPDAATIATGSTIVFGGWMSDASKQVPKNASLVLKGAQASYYAALSSGVERPDVAASLGSDALRTSGFNLSTVLQNVSPGNYELLVVYTGATPVFCSFNKGLTVTG